MERVMIIGSCGAGKSTLAKKLAEKTGLPLIHLDRLYWKENWASVSMEEFDRLLAEEIAKEHWIIDGNYSRTLEVRLARCDTVIFLDYSRIVCLFGVIIRVLKGYGKVRPDMAEGCPERFDPAFLKFVWHFPEKNREKYYAMLETKKDAQVVILKNRRECKRFLASVGK